MKGRPKTPTKLNLDNSLNVVGAKLIIDITQVAVEELRPCNTLGIGYPGISIVDARLVN